MIAIGKPGEMPRCWFEGPADLLEGQIEAGEVSSANITLDDDGRPVPTPLPKSAN